MKNTKIKLLSAILCGALLLMDGCDTRQKTVGLTQHANEREAVMIENNVHLDQIVTKASLRFQRI